MYAKKEMIALTLMIFLKKNLQFFCFFYKIKIKPLKFNFIYLRKELCKFYLSGFCEKGKNCMFSHDLKNYPCKFYFGFGSCN